MKRKSTDTIEQRKLPALTTRAAFEPATFNADARTIEIVWTTGAKGLRSGYFSDDYYEELSLEPGAVKLDRLNRGAPLLNAHSRYALSDVIGVVERAWIAGNEGRATVRFSERADVQPIMKDVADGILRNISVGYQVNKYLRVPSNTKGEPDTLRAIDWEPFELSFVPVGFDAAAQARSADTAPEATRTVVQIVTTVWTDEPAEDTTEDTTDATESTPAADQSRTTSTQENIEQGAQRTEPIHSTRAALEITTMENTQPSGAEQMQRILAIGDQFRAYVPNIDKLVGDCLRAGKSEDDLREEVMKSITSRHTDMSQAYIGLDDGESKKYSMGRAIAAVLTGDWSQAGLERAASDAVAKKFGKQPEGFFVPMDAFRDFTAGTASEAGNLIATDFRADLFTDVLRKQLCLADLGCTFLPGLTGNLAIPRKTVASTLAWVTEVGAAAETSPTTGQITMGPKRISAFIEYSKQSLIQSSIAIEPMLRKDLLDGLSLEIEDKGINGTAASNQPRGLRNTSGVGSVVGGTNGANWAWTHVVGLETAAANANARGTANAGYLINTKTVGTSKQTQKAANLPFIWDNTDRPLNGYKAAVSNLMPSNLTKGTSSGNCSSAAFSMDWSMHVIGLFGAVDITIDPFTLSKDGLVRITINHFIDVANRQPAAFAVMDDVLTP